MRLNRIKDTDLFLYSQCPRAFYFYKHNNLEYFPPKSQTTKAFSFVVKSMYNYTCRFNKLADWKEVIRYVNFATYKSMDNEILAKKTAEKVLEINRTWYNEIYLKEKVQGVAQYQYEYLLDNLIIEGQIPALRINHDKVIFTYILDNRLCFNYRNYLPAHTALARISQLEQDADVLLEFLLVKDQSIDIKYCSLTEAKTNRIDKTICSLADCITRKYYYPSIGLYCKYCRWHRKCHF